MFFSVRALCTQPYSGGTSELALPGVPPSPSARSLSRSSRRDLSASLSLRISQSVSQSAGATRFARIAPYAKRARTHAREGSSSSDHLLSLCCLIDRGGGQPCVEITSHRGGGVGEDLLLRTAGDVRGDGVKSGISHASNGRHASSAFAGDKQSGKRCPLRYLSTCVLSFFFISFTTATGKGRSFSSSSSYRCRACNTWRWHWAALVEDDYYAIGCGRPGRGDGARSAPGRHARPAQASLREGRAKVRYISLDRSATNQDVQRYTFFEQFPRISSPFAIIFLSGDASRYLKYVSSMKFNSAIYRRKIKYYSYRVTFLPPLRAVF